MKKLGLVMKILLLMIALGVMSTNTIHAKSALKVKIESGIDGKVQMGKGFPIQVTIENTGKNYIGDLVIDFSPDYQAAGGKAFSLNVPANSTKTYQFSLPGFSDSSNMSFQGNKKKQMVYLFDGDWEKGKEVDFSGDKILTPHMVNPNQSITGILSENPDDLEQIKISKLQTGAYIETVILTEKNMPSEAAGLEVIDLLVIDDFSLTTLSLDQQEAVLEWTEQGGKILIGAMENSDQKLGSLAAFLPMNMSKEEKISSLEFLKKNKESALDFSTLPILTGEQKEGTTTIIEVEGFPVVTKNTIRQGEVWQTAFSYGAEPLASWKDFNLWFSWLIEEMELPQGYGTSSKYGTRMYEQMYYEFANTSNLFKASEVSTSVLIGILVLYLLLVAPLLYFVLKKWDKREYAWGIIPLIAILASVGIFITGAKDRLGKPQTSSMEVYEVQEDQSLIGVKAQSLLSNTGGDFTLSYKTNEFNAFPAMNAYDNTANFYQYATIEDQNNQSTATFSGVEFWSTRTVFGYAKKDSVGKFEQNLTLRDKQLQGTITNHFPFDFQELYVWSASQEYKLGPIKAGETIEVQVNIKGNHLSSPSKGSSKSFSSYPQDQDIAKLKQQQMESMVGTLFTVKKNGNNPVIAGYSDQAVVEAMIHEKEEKLNNYSLIYQPFKIESNFKGTFKLKSDDLLAELKVIDGFIMEELREQSFTEYVVEAGSYELVLTLPQPLNSSNANFNEIKAAAINMSPGFNYYIKNAKNGDKQLLTPSSSGVITLSENVNEFITSTGEIRFTIETNNSNSDFFRLPDFTVKGEVK
ncbi:hypothetical protein [Bacillus sp. 2205SS5-2]|uniref:hypothetical protein n=1 Tax=Bacillus sp. 2205SS5-2 TaxID=3109031 RepID=UPI003006FBAF